LFESLYQSAWQHPGIAFIAASSFLLLFASRRSFLSGWTAIFLFEIVADAFVTGKLSPVAHGSELEKTLGITFVILGDFRYFLLVSAYAVARAAPRGLGPPSAWFYAAIFAFIVPVASVAPQKTWADVFSNTRHVFLLYEAMFFAFAVALRFSVLPRRLATLDASLRGWLLRVTTFEIVQYGLWITADVIILAGVDAGYLLRIVPNALYYGAFVPFVFLTAPGAAKA
jgi:hypothetical protein